ncbi:hypothetical protein HOE67_01805 [Candidatus Peregrinibacteria bacterium]|jgi:hypothetical protein|nr:hypothetical protein [Candidatus Peregrinibacteria bacterium]MBT4055822.1 hypothetical protein [Candidatus Peregrinibacteria bacterium]
MASSQHSLSTLSDKQLYQLCKKYGGNSLYWRRRFEALLPEIEARRLYKKRGFHSVHEFAAKLAGIGHETVNQILRTYRNLEDKPLLKKKAEEQGWTKVRTVATISTPETEKMWAEKVDLLSKSALETYVRDYKEQVAKTGEGDNDFLKIGLLGQNQTCKTVPGNELTEEKNTKTITLKLDSSTEFQLRKLKQKFEKEKGEPLTFNQFFKIWVAKTEGESNNKTAKAGVAKKTEAQKPATRHISVALKSVVDEIYQDKCACSTCNKPAEIYHHIDEFALVKHNPAELVHRPDNILPLCRGHEQMVHAGLVDLRNWVIRKKAEMSFVDGLVQRYRVGGART